MIRFANPGSDIDGIIRIYCELFEALNQTSPFDLDDMSLTLVQRNLATSSGYMGERALEYSTREDRSRDPLYNQSKMYSEIFKLLGWIHPLEDSALTFTFTYLGAHAASAKKDPKALLLESILGITFPNPILDSQGDYKLRPFASILLSIAQLDGVICRDEIIIGPMSLSNDRNPDLFKEMIRNIKKLRGSREALSKEITKLSNSRGITRTTMGNYTRFPLAILRWSDWVISERDSSLYGRSIPVLKLTPKGDALIKKLKDRLDIRYSDLTDTEEEKLIPIAKLAFYQMLSRAGFDIEPLKPNFDDWNRIVEEEFKVREPELQFSPFQDLPPNTIQDIFKYSPTRIDPSSEVAAQHIARRVLEKPILYRIKVVESDLIREVDVDEGLLEMIQVAYSTSGNIKGTINQIMADKENSDQTDFYPFISGLFRILGYNCEHSRAGVNYQRWDAIIIDDEHSIPIEIKSPAEEEFLSPKSIRQALENKIILLSRKIYPTSIETTSLSVGYRIPNERSDVNSLLSDIHNAYNLKIGVIDLESLLFLVCSELYCNKKHDREALITMHGMIDV